MAVYDAQIQFKISKQTAVDFKDKVANFIKATANQNPLELQFKINIPESTKNISERLDKIFARIKPFEISVTPSIPESKKKAIADKLALDLIDVAKNIPANSIPLIAFGVNEKATETNIRKSLATILQKVQPNIKIGLNQSNQTPPSQRNSSSKGNKNSIINLLPGLADQDKDKVAGFLMDSMKKIEDSTKNTTKIEISERIIKDAKGKIKVLYDAAITETDKQNGKWSKHLFQIKEDGTIERMGGKAVFDKSKIPKVPMQKQPKPFNVTSHQENASYRIMREEMRATESHIDFTNVKKMASQITDADSLKAFESEFLRVSNAVKIYRGEIASTLDPNQKFIKDMKEFPGVAASWEEKLNRLGTKVDVRLLREKLLEAKQIRDELEDTTLNLSPEVRTAKKKSFDSIMADISVETRRIEQVLKTAGSASGESNQLKSILEQLEKYYIKYKAAIDQVPGLTEKFQSVVSKLQSDSYADVKTARADFLDFKQEARSAGVEIETFSQKVHRLFGNNLASAYAAFGIHAIMNNLMKLYQNVVKIDTALTELRKVSNATWVQMGNYLDKATDRSVKLGIEISNLINASAGFARLGYNLEQSAKLGEVASVLFNVGDKFQSVEDATESIVSAMHAFNIESERAMTIADKLNGVSNKFSISAAGIATAMKKSASALSVAGNTIDETMGLIVGGNVVVQDPEVVGNVLKTMSLRLRSAKVDLEEAGLETEGMANSVSTLAKKIEQLTNLNDNGGFSILEDSGNLKSTYDMLKGISQAYSEMDGNSTNAAALLELISGKRNANAAASILTNFDSVEAAMKTSTQSQGSAMAEHERWLESIEAKTARLNAQLQELSVVLINSKAAKGFIDILWGLTRALTKLIDLSGSIPLIITGFAGLASKKLNFGNSSENLPFPTLMSAVA